MEHKERMGLLNEWDLQLFQVDNIRKQIDEIFGCCIDSQFYSVMIDLAGKYTKAVADLVGDSGDWLEWYWLENDMGARGHEAKASNWKKLRKVTNIEVLCKLIEADIE